MRALPCKSVLNGGGKVMAKKTQLGYKEIEQRLSVLKEPVDASIVGYMLLLTFGKSEREVSRYVEGKGVIAKFDGLLIKGLLAYRPSDTLHLRDTLETLKRDLTVLRAAPKIVAVSDGRTLLAYDLREKETYENPLSRLHCDFAFFYPLMDIERVRYVEENPADIKAAEKLAKLHDELRAYNDFSSDDDLHDLNIFITRLLFCFFAEDTGIFKEQLFTSSIERYTKPDGSDLSDYLDEAFNIMDRPQRSDDTPHIITQFPYVNGGLFSRRIAIPRMGAKARRIILECGELDWKDINPDIFGSMIQAVVNPEERATQGMHYTSVPNIMKVINPLFLDELHDVYNKLKADYDRQKQLLDMGGQTGKAFRTNCLPIIRKGNELLARISRMKFFDPACGSGNFLIITYKSLRLLEMDILRLQQLCQGGQRAIGSIMGSVIRIDQFYGIELLDFPHEVAMLSLWLAEHQMNKKLFDNFGIQTDALPLHNITQIVCGNACRLDWESVCPHTADEEVFVFGNPPYLGARLQDDSQKQDITRVLGNLTGANELDYIACWFYKSAHYIMNSHARVAFVSTNSICQGEQVGILWPVMLQHVHISFAYSWFKWSNNAKHNAGVTCTIIGLEALENHPCKMYNQSTYEYVDSINPYLIKNADLIVTSSNVSLSNLPDICFGSMANDGGALLLSPEEKEHLISESTLVERYIHQIVGSQEFIRGEFKYCLWIEDNELEEALSVVSIKQRIERCRENRLKSKRPATNKLASKAHCFAECRHKNKPKIFIPRVSSEHREYIPMGLLDKQTVVSDSAFAIYDAKTWLFGILTSRMHMTWVRTVGGRLKTDYRYSAQLCYNTFPFPKVNEAKKKEIEEAAEEVLITREYYPGQTLAELYDPDTMPQDLRDAHARLDDIVESCYPGYPFANDEARLECLFRLYERMTAK